MSTKEKRHRHREDRQVDDGRVRKSKRGSRSRSRQRRRRDAGAPTGSSLPPQEWLGPRDARGAPPAEWRGPPGYGGMPPGAYPPPRAPPEWFGDRGGPQRPPGNFPGMSPVARGQVPPDYGWPGMPHPGEPPPEWRGPAMRPPTGHFGHPQAHQGSPFAPPGFPSAIGTDRLDVPAGDARGPGSEQAPVPVSAIASDPSSALGASISQADDDKPPPRTITDRFNNIRIVRSALGDGLITYLKSKGVKIGHQAAPTIAGSEELGPAEELAMARECSRLGLDGGAQRARLPMPGPLKLPVCTAELSQVGLWDKFRQRCGTPLPAEPQPIPFEIRKSPGGGQVVVPLVPAASPAAPQVACN